MNHQYWRKRFCLYCGKEIEEGTRFCSQCGRDLSGLESENSIELGKIHKSKKFIMGIYHSSINSYREFYKTC